MYYLPLQSLPREKNSQSEIQESHWTDLKDEPRSINDCQVWAESISREFMLSVREVQNLKLCSHDDGFGGDRDISQRAQMLFSSFLNSSCNCSFRNNRWSIILVVFILQSASRLSKRRIVDHLHDQRTPRPDFHLPHVETKLKRPRSKPNSILNGLRRGEPPAESFYHQTVPRRRRFRGWADSLQTQQLLLEDDCNLHDLSISSARLKNLNAS